MKKSYFLAIVIGLLSVFVIDFVAGLRPKNSDFQYLQEAQSIDQPMVAAAASGKTLNDEAQVIGVVSNGSARAYLIKSMVYHPGRDTRGAGVHVINDVLGSSFFAVTYCDQMNCGRVFERGENDFVKVVGFSTSKGMILSAHEREFLQNSSNAALTDHPFEIATWGQWRAKHPNSSLYK